MGAPTPPPAAVEPAVDGVASAEPVLRGDEMRPDPGLRDVLFALDSASLPPETRPVLVANAAWIMGHGDARVQVAGDCDERGTVEYNLALGQRRAEAVREYYVHLGVPGSRVATISYGKERPVCDEPDESCWSRNRRAQTLVAFPAPVSQAAPPAVPQAADRPGP